MANDIITQVMNRPGLTISVTSEELMKFSNSLIEEAEARIKKANEAKAREMYVTAEEAKERVGKSKATLSRWAERGKLHPKRVGTALLYSIAELDAVLDGRI